MPTRDGIRGVADSNVLSPANRVADAQTSGFDTRDGDAASFHILTGAAVNAGFAAVVQVSDDDGAGDPYAAAPAADVIGDAVGAGDFAVNSAKKVGYVGPKRYARLALTIPGATDCAVLALAGYLHQQADADA